MNGETRVRRRRTLLRVLLVAPVPPPYGGMALQAAQLKKLLESEGISAELLGHNHLVPRRFCFLERIPGVRTFLRMLLFARAFWIKVQDRDVVHILAASWFNFLLVVCPAIFMAHICRKRVILNYRAGDAARFLKYCACLVKPFFEMADLITAPSGFLSQVIGDRIGVRVSIVPNILDQSKFRFRQRLSFQPKIIVTRHLEKLYGVEMALRAFRQIQSAHPAAALWIAGTGRQEAHLRRLVAEWKLANVQFLGYVDHARLSQIYDQCDILLNGSYVDNFPGSLMEAAASGLLVISTKAGGIPYLFEHRKNALLVEVGDWEGLASQVELVLLDQELARQLTEAAIGICEQCQWHNLRESLLATYGLQLSRFVEATEVALGK